MNLYVSLSHICIQGICLYWIIIQIRVRFLNLNHSFWVIKKVHTTKTKCYHPFHLSCAFYRDLNNSFQFEFILCLSIQLFTYWISIFSTSIALGKIKGSVILFKSTFRNWKVKYSNSMREYLRIAWNFSQVAIRTFVQIVLRVYNLLFLFHLSLQF